MIKKLLYNIFIRPNVWYDAQPEPKRCLIFFVPFTVLVLIGTIHIWVYAVFFCIAIPRLVYLRDHALYESLKDYMKERKKGK